MLTQDTANRKTAEMRERRDTRATNQHNPRPIATIPALIAAAVLIILMVLGSRGLRDFDAAHCMYALSRPVHNIICVIYGSNDELLLAKLILS